MVKPQAQPNDKQTGAGGQKEGKKEGTKGGSGVGGSAAGGSAVAAAAESLSFLPADLVPVFCHRDPLLLGLVIRP